MQYPTPRSFHLALLILCLGVGPALAQELDTPVELEETHRLGLGARIAGLGGTAVAFTDDLSSLLWNPAGLASIRRGEFSAGLQFNRDSRELSHFGTSTAVTSPTRLEHLAGAWPVTGVARSMAISAGIHTLAGLEQSAFKEGFLVEPVQGTPGLYEVDAYDRSGSIHALSTGVGVQLTRNLSVGATVSLLFGETRERVTVANYRATLSGNEITFDLGTPADADERLFKQEADRDSDATGLSGALGFQARTDAGVLLGGVIDLPRRVVWTGVGDAVLEDTEKVDSFSGFGFRDEITLPLSLAGGVAWQRDGVTLAADLRWTDHRDIDFEGPILAPQEGNTFQRRSAYRSVVAWSAGAEVSIPNAPLRLRGGVFRRPLPYRLIAADPDFRFEAAGPEDEGASVVARDYPTAVISSDRFGWSAGAGLALEGGFAVDAAFQESRWERRTPDGYENTTTFYVTRPTRESLVERQVWVTARLVVLD